MEIQENFAQSDLLFLLSRSEIFDWPELEIPLQKYGKVSLADLVADRVEIKKARVYPLPDEEVWKIRLMEDICLTKKDQLEIDFDLENLDDILQHICTS